MKVHQIDILVISVDVILIFHVLKTSREIIVRFIDSRIDTMKHFIQNWEQIL